MESAELNVTVSWVWLAETVLAATALLLALTGAAAFATVIDPGLIPAVAPHPTLTGSVGDWLSIVANNLRECAAPFVLLILATSPNRGARVFGDLLIVAIVALNVIDVGLALGRWQGQLVPYIPQLPVEWAALAAAVCVWVLTRRRGLERRTVTQLALLCTVLVLAAAALETWATPHRHTLRATAGLTVDQIQGRTTSRWGAGSDVPRLSMPWAGSHAARSQAPFPSLRSVPLTGPSASSVSSINPGSHKEGSPC